MAYSKPSCALRAAIPLRQEGKYGPRNRTEEDSFSTDREGWIQKNAWEDEPTLRAYDQTFKVWTVEQIFKAQS